MQTANSWLFEGRWSIYSSWLGNKVHRYERQEESLKVTCYLHLINSCNYDWFSILSVPESLFVTMKLQNPGIKKASLRLLEVLYYHSSKLVSSLRELGHRQEIELGRYDHFEPQSGKDMSERILCPLKASIRRYCNEGHNVVSAKNMHTALKERLTSQGNDSVSAHSLGTELDPRN